MDMSVAQRLRMYIDAETSDAALYRELAKKAPTEADKKLLLEFSEDEHTHAETFSRIYRRITGQTYAPEAKPTVLEGTFAEILRDRVLDESGDYRKYGIQYLLAQNSRMLREAFYRARTDENVHALRLLDMLSGLWTGPGRPESLSKKPEQSTAETSKAPETLFCEAEQSEQAET